MKRITKILAGAVWDLVIIGGAVAIAVGVGMIYMPAGLIAGGALAIAASVISAMAENAAKGEKGGGGRCV